MTKVPIENILGERGGGFKIAINSLNVGRIKLAAATIEGQRHVTTLAVQYANQRVQFKSPISSFGAIQCKIASMATYCFAQNPLLTDVQMILKTEFMNLRVTGVLLRSQN